MILMRSKGVIKINLEIYSRNSYGTHTHTHIHTVTNTWTHINIHTYAHRHTLTHTHTHSHTHTRTYTHTHTHIQNKIEDPPAVGKMDNMTNLHNHGNDIRVRGVIYEFRFVPKPFRVNQII